jgi:hypothetical protein
MMEVSSPFLQRELRVFSDGSFEVKEFVLPRYIGWRALHRPEEGRITPNAMPCVIPSKTIPPIPMTKEIQLLAYYLNREFPEWGGNDYRSVYNGSKAFTNNHGYDSDEPNPRDYVNGLDLYAVEDNGFPLLPKLMDGIVCAGNFFTGVQIGSEVEMLPGRDAIDANKPIPSLEEVMAKHWYFHATSAKFDVSGTWKVSNFPNCGIGNPVRIPYVLREPTRYALEYFIPWSSNELPDPLRIYY